MSRHGRGTTNGNVRGNWLQRRARRRWLVRTYGDGEFVDCHLRAVPDCWVAMTEWTVSADRYPIPGAAGGTYARDNIRPACPPCQSHTGGKLGAARKREKINA